MKNNKYRTHSRGPTECCQVYRLGKGSLCTDSGKELDIELLLKVTWNRKNSKNDFWRDSLGKFIKEMDRERWAPRGLDPQFHPCLRRLSVCRVQISQTTGPGSGGFRNSAYQAFKKIFVPSEIKKC